MGLGFTETPVPEAPDVPPDNDFNPQGFASEMARGFINIKEELNKALESYNFWQRQYIKLLVWLVSKAAWLLQVLLKYSFDELQPLAGALVQGAGTVMSPLMQTLGSLTGVYVQQLVNGLQGVQRGTPGAPRPAMSGGAQGLYDQILAPMAAFTAGANPALPGAGEANSQFALGAITSVHLSTWAVNIISNLIGVGMLKFINSFDDVVTAALNSRSIGRLALRPYLRKYMADPLERDLNVKYPLALGSLSALLKRYIRGNMTAEELKAGLRGQGYDDAVVADLLLDNAKLFTPDELVSLIQLGSYTEDQAVEALKQQGYPEHVARTKLQKPHWDLMDSQYLSLANSLVGAFVDRRLDNPTLRYLLGKAGFTEDEVNALVTRGAILQELPTKLTLAQVKDLYAEGVEDLTYVYQWLMNEGYSEEDADRLVLLYFTKKEERQQRAAAQTDTQRVSAEGQAAQDAATLAAQQAELQALG
jgi:hypothetical protein